ncbi:CPXCG motif-containing cysteine-rich protein [Gammaproteobacteria bacterium]|nr:CPXCG motif-containing cysteine-rich protein [Gammaproteobacteria bacterium]MDC3385983.1 CPXCG motif-containing cysteine-rich protein [Gammaproteobacteria bacterium]|tara:strand:- start:289 stop:477 length:189 start_codon:yes stop_codon:yes gene_type:complete
MDIDEKESYCPYCGESISLLIDNSIENQEYVEDCQVCCSPILISIEIDHDGNIYMNTRRENE